MAPKLKVITLELIKYILLVVSLIIVSCLFLWIGWIITLGLMIDFGGIRLFLEWLLGIALVFGAYAWLLHRKVL